jgi:hypothetical protein
MPMAANEINSAQLSNKRPKIVEWLQVVRHHRRKIALPVRFAEVKGEAEKPTNRRKKHSTPPEDT